ncbi:MAG: outer membrane protein transport protein [Deltaproteobacteria bacterium]|nr:outer membrane protein transport protein [Deltaproteobacteria bacterium]
MLLWLLALGWSPRALASPVETFGFLPTDEGRAGAAVASGELASAAVTNPGALASGERAEVALAWRYEHLALRLQGERARTLDPHLAALGAGVPFTLGPLRAGAGFALALPDAFLARIALDPPTRPRMVLFDNRVHRVVFNAAVALELFRGVSLGVGATIFADGAGNGVDFRVGAAPGRTVAEGALDVTLPLRAAPVVGLWVSRSPRWAFGLRASGPLSFVLALDVVAQASVPGTSLDGDAVIAVRGVDFYTPAELCAGARWSPTERLRLHAEVSLKRWSDAPHPSSDVGVRIAIGVSPSLVSSRLPAPGWRDIVVPRVALEQDLGAFTVRAGYAFLPSPVPRQTGATRYADNDRHALSVGLGWTSRPWLGARWRWDLALAWQHLVSREDTPREPLTPGGALTSEGEVLGGSLGLRAGW